MRATPTLVRLATHSHIRAIFSGAGGRTLRRVRSGGRASGSAAGGETRPAECAARAARLPHAGIGHGRVLLVSANIPCLRCGAHSLTHSLGVHLSLRSAWPMTRSTVSSPTTSHSSHAYDFQLLYERVRAVVRFRVRTRILILPSLDMQSCRDQVKRMEIAVASPDWKLLKKKNGVSTFIRKKAQVKTRTHTPHAHHRTRTHTPHTHMEAGAGQEGVVYQGPGDGAGGHEHTPRVPPPRGFPPSRMRGPIDHPGPVRRLDQKAPPLPLRQHRPRRAPVRPRRRHHDLPKAHTDRLCVVRVVFCRACGVTVAGGG